MTFDEVIQSLYTEFDSIKTQSQSESCYQDIRKRVENAELELKRMKRRLDEEIEKMARTFWLSFDGINDYNLP